MVEVGQVWRSSHGTRWRIIEVRPGFVSVEALDGYVRDRVALPTAWFALESPTAPKLERENGG